MSNSLLKYIFNITYLDQTIKVKVFNFIKLRKRIWLFKYPYKEATEYGLEKNTREIRIIASLTSFPGRIMSVNKTINTLLTQSLKPDKLILWLSDTQFKNKEDDLPNELLKLKNYGLEIKWCNNLKSYKKLIPSLKEFPNDIIITFDDDMYYPNNTIEDLYNSYLKNKSAVHTMRARKLVLQKGQIRFMNYEQEIDENKKDLSFNNMLIGCSGCLYPPNCFYKDIFDEDLILSLIPTHDDIYFWAMAILGGTKIQIVNGYDQSFHYVEGTQKGNLAKLNRKNSVGIPPYEAFDRIQKKYNRVSDLLRRTI